MLITCMEQRHTMWQGDGAGVWGDRLSPLLRVIFFCILFACLLPAACSALPGDDDAPAGISGSEPVLSGYWCSGPLCPENFSSENLTAVFFYSEHCIACTKSLPVVDELSAAYPSVTFLQYTVWNSTENESLFFTFGEAYGNMYPRYPTVFLSDGTFFEGYNAISVDLPLHMASFAGMQGGAPVSLPAAPVTEEIPVALSLPVASPVDAPVLNFSSSPAAVSTLPPVGVVALAGLIDGINPCAVAVLIFLLLTLAGAGGRVQQLRFGAAYVTGVYLMYFVSGFGILAAVRVAGISRYFSIAAGVIAVLLGVVMVADSFRETGDARLRISAAWLDGVRRIAVRGGIFSAFLAGIVVSFIELPCTGGVYLAILGMLSGSEVWAAAGLLALYNVMFVLPLAAIIVAVAFGFPPERMAEFRKESRKVLRLLGGCFLILLGAAVVLWFSF